MCSWQSRFFYAYLLRSLPALECEAKVGQLVLCRSGRGHLYGVAAWRRGEQGMFMHPRDDGLTISVAQDLHGDPGVAEESIGSPVRGRSAQQQVSLRDLA